MTLRDGDDFDPTDIEQADGEQFLGATEFGVTAEEEPAPETMEELDVLVGMGDEFEMSAEEAAMHETDIA